MVPDFNHAHSKLWELENRRLSDQYRIATDTGCIVSASAVSGKPDIMCITAGQQLLTGRITWDEQQAFVPRQSIFRMIRQTYHPPKKWWVLLIIAHIIIILLS